MGSWQYLKTANQRRAVGKSLASLDKKLQKVEWGEYKLEDLFTIQTVKSIDEGKLNLAEQKHDGLIEFVGRTRVENGIKGYTEKLDLKPNPKNVISITQIGTIVAQLRKQEWYASQNIFSLTPKEEYKHLISLYGVASVDTALRATFSDGYANYPTLEKLKNLKIKLPTKNDEIDFAFMESFIAELEAERIAELEAERIAELEAYLVASGLKDYTLTKEEKKVLADFEKQEFSPFKVIDVFAVKNTGNILSREIVENSGDTPYLGASSDNNSVSSYISYDEKYLEIGNCVFIGGKTFVVSYQEKDFYSNDSHNLVLYLKDTDKQTKQNYLYFAACVNKSLKHKYSWGDSISNKKIQKDTVTLPAKNDQPDYDKMETFISAIQKLVIKDVVQYTDRMIAATHAAIGAP